MSEELKKCPFCGDVTPELVMLMGYGYVECRKCKIKTPTLYEPITSKRLFERLIELWNTRADAEGKE